MNVQKESPQRGKYTTVLWIGFWVCAGIVGIFFGVLSYQERPSIDDARQWLEKKYGENFTVELTSEWNILIAYPESNPEQEVRVYFASYEWEGISYYLDNYCQLKIEDELQKNEQLNVNMNNKSYPIILADNPENYQQVAKELAKTLDRALIENTDRQEGEIYLSIGSDTMGDTEVRLKLAEYAQKDEKERTQYLYGLFCDMYENRETAHKEQQEREEKAREEEAKRWETPTEVQGAFLCLYQEVLEPMGYTYQANTEGVLYAWIDREELKGTNKKERIVYDRISSNGKCYLFVHYSTLYENGQEMTTGIKNMYAVEMETGRVVVSGKTAWADVGTREYREITGE